MTRWGFLLGGRGIIVKNDVRFCFCAASCDVFQEHLSDAYRRPRSRQVAAQQSTPIVFTNSQPKAPYFLFRHFSFLFFLWPFFRDMNEWFESDNKKKTGPFKTLWRFNKCDVRWRAEGCTSRVSLHIRCVRLKVIWSRAVRDRGRDFFSL